MKKRSWMNATAALVLCIAAGDASAHSGMHGPGSKYDSDGDGVLSLEEYTVYLKESNQDVKKTKELFGAVDLNKDGRLSEAEFLKGLKAAKQ